MDFKNIQLNTLLNILEPQLMVDIQYCLNGSFKSSGIYTVADLKSKLDQALLKSYVKVVRKGLSSLIIQMDSLQVILPAE